MEAVDTLSTYGASAWSSVATFSTLTFVAVGLFVFLFLLALHKGRENIVSLILAFYFAYLAQDIFPYYDSLFSFGSEMVIRCAVFLGLATLAFIVFRRVMWVGYDEGGVRWIDAALLALTAILLMAAIFFALFPQFHMPLINSSVTSILSNPSFLFFWILAPLGAIFIASRQ